MTTAELELIEAPAPARAVTAILFPVTPKTISEMAVKYGSLTVQGASDVAGFEAVTAALKATVNARTTVESTRVALKAPSIKEGKDIDAKAKQLAELIAPIEAHLKTEKERVEKELEKLARAESDRVYKIRLELLTVAGGRIPESILRAMSEAQFHTACQAAAENTKALQAQAKADQDAADERKRLADERDAMNKQEADRLAAERDELQRQYAAQETERLRQQKETDDRNAAYQARLDAQQELLDDAQAKVAAETKRLADIEAERVAQADRDRRAAEDAAQAVLDAAAKKRQDEIDEENRLADEAALAARQEAMKPLRLKVLQFADRILNLPTPAINPDVDRRVIAILDDAASAICNLADSLV